MLKISNLLARFRSDLAVDLGTANTLLGIVGEGVVLSEPSIVAVQRGSGRVLSGGCAVGQLAKQMEGRTPENIAVVRPLNGGVIADFELCEAMLRYFLRKARRSGKWLRPRVLLGIPGGITPVEKRAAFNSMHRAGAAQVWVVPAAKAAALGAGLPIAEPTASMVCAIGGGTTELAVISLAETVSAQSIRIGGDRMDQALVDYLRRTHNLRIGLPAAERLKIDLGSAYPLEEERTVELSGVDTISGLPRRITISSEEIRQALATPLQEIIEAVKATIDGCGAELAADLMHNGLVLCGGGALLRRMDRFINEQTGLPVRIDGDPLTTVVRGLLICFEQFSQFHRWRQSSEEDV